MLFEGNRSVYDLVMPVGFELFEKYAPAIAALPEADKLSKNDLYVPAFERFSGRCGSKKQYQLSMYYAPFDYVNDQAMIAIIGITPGEQQMLIAFKAARTALAAGQSYVEACTQAKIQASFAGQMRVNLIDWLNGIGLPTALGISTSKDLFESQRDLLHTTSAIRYPTLINGKNYSGYSPSWNRVTVLNRHVRHLLASELRRMNNALIVTLGRTVREAVLASMSGESVADRLINLPHPSSGKGYEDRKKDYMAHRSEYGEKVSNWFAGMR